MIAKFNVQFQLLARPRSKSKNLFLNISSSFSKYSTKFFSLSLFIFFFFWRSRDRVEIARYFFLEKTSHRLSFDLEKQIFSLIFFSFSLSLSLARRSNQKLIRFFNTWKKIFVPIFFFFFEVSRSRSRLALYTLFYTQKLVFLQKKKHDQKPKHVLIMNLSRVEIAVYFGRRRKKNRKREREPSNILAGGGRISCRNHALKPLKNCVEGRNDLQLLLSVSLSQPPAPQRERKRERREREERLQSPTIGVLGSLGFQKNLGLYKVSQGLEHMPMSSTVKT